VSSRVINCHQGSSRVIGERLGLIESKRLSGSIGDQSRPHAAIASALKALAFVEHGL